MSNWKKRSAAYGDFERALEEARQLEEAAARKHEQATRIMYERMLPQTPEEIEEDLLWLEDVIQAAGDGAAVIDAEGNIIGRVLPVDGKVILD